MITSFPVSQEGGNSVYYVGVVPHVLSSTTVRLTYATYEDQKCTKLLLSGSFPGSSVFYVTVTVSGQSKSSNGITISAFGEGNSSVTGFTNLGMTNTATITGSGVLSGQQYLKGIKQVSGIL